MCGRYNVTDSPYVRALMAGLGVPLYPQDRVNVAPGSEAQFVATLDGERRLTTGLWSALIEAKPDGSGYRPNPKFKTFNARYDRLQSSPLWRKLYRSQRAIVPASAWYEWLGKQCYQLAPTGAAIAFGGLYQLYRFGDRLVPAFAIITLPPHDRVRHIHDNSLPLMLRPQDYDAWLDPGFTHVDDFADLLHPVLYTTLQVTPIDGPKTLRATDAHETRSVGNRGVERVKRPSALRSIVG